MGDVVEFCGVTRLDIDPDRLLNAAEGNVETVVIIGYDKNGDFYFSSSKADGAEVLWLMELTRKALMEVGDEN